jgi:tRNA uridine 5-carbamoylmethylation protein Kti12/predicted nuclease of restriction endonuclease-like (RecB) superfamily
MAQNFQLQLASEFVQFTDKNIFLTGKAGTGKTTFLHRLKENCPKRMVIVAPTGVAAINAGGSTIHSFFQLAFGPYVPNADQKSFQHKMNKQKISLIKSLDLLVIDEISMVRADTLDNIDEVLRRYRDRNKPFGGVQLLMIGDLHQLSPVVKDQDWELLKSHYNNLYFFNSKALQQTSPISIELKHIYRQSDTFFIDILNAVRENRIDEQVLEQLNQRYIPNFNPNEEEGYITLTSHNQSANIINDEKLKSLKTKSYHYKADVKGEFPEFSYPNALELELKEGAQVMFVKNDASRDKLYFNGKIGKIIKIKDDYIHVKCPGDLQEIVVSRVEWENTKYELNPETKEIEEKVIGSFIQYPIKLAWAITIHKSQGLTFEKAIIDANAAFAHGQVYVALSRCKSFEGMVLRTPISFNSIKTDGTVASYTKNAEQNSPGEQHLVEAKVVFQRNLLLELFDFKKLKSALYLCKKLAEEYHQIISLGFLENINAVREVLENDIYAVAEKFNRQIAQYLQQGKLPEENEELQERVKKACTYFVDKLTALHQDLDKVSFDADNKTIKKQFLEAMEQVEKEVFIKQSSLKLCCNGFQTLSYLKTKANAEIDFLNLKKAAPVEKVTAPVSGVQHPELYKTIKTWRDQLAADNNAPVYHILPQKVLLDLVNKLPSNFQELESIKGMGKTKVKQFGNELLVMISDYCEKKEVSQTPFQLFVKTTAEKIDTKKLSYDLFKTGKTLQEIALERNLAPSTIETHLTHYIGTGDLDIFSFVNKSKVSQIQDYIWRNKPSSMNDTKAALGEEISYGEIRAVMKFMELNNS